MPETTTRTETVRVARDGPVATLTLDRPDGRNSFDVATLHQMLAAVQDLSRDPDVRAVVVTGTGRFFCTGADLAEMAAQKARAPAHFDDLTLPYHALLLAMRTSDTVFVAAVNGIAAGGGVGLALNCDLVVAAAGAKFVTAYANLGVSPDGGASYHLTRLLGPQRARAAFLLDEGIDAERMAAWGLVLDVVDDAALMQAAMETAQKATGRALFTVRHVKRLVDQAHDTPLATVLEDERRTIIAAAATDDFQEGLAAFTEKRAPRFQGA